jgi:succinoglycan biosynthesis protein ExoA
MRSKNHPFVSLILPIRNEAAYIERCIEAVFAQDYPADRMEILIVDGMSIDGTREMVKQIIAGQRKDYRHDSVSLPPSPVIFLDNPGRIVPTGLNIALRRAKGEIVILVGGHCEIVSNYVLRCVELLAETSADCVGGPMVTVGERSAAHVIALAQSSRFGVGGAAFRTGKRKGCYVDTVAFGAYRRKVFDCIGGFDEELIRNQDDEFNFRLKQAGGKIWLDPSIRCVYYSRASFGKLWRQYFQYGLYKVRLIQKRGAVPSVRHLIPGGFVLGLLASFGLALGMSQPIFALSVAGPYVLACIMASLWTSRRAWHTLPMLPLAFSTLHISYGMGFVLGLWRWRQGWWTPPQRISPAKRIETIDQADRKGSQELA